ncbi:Inactive serine/threonine-protein kinase ZRK12 [Cardamine amara subsp. amara]|uniref:Inactive serine/threonine-protein kinase ZRK12 n=1 Tax=Cardamine amara subsp. amara TaxID=228776 RepID=A0ABD1BL85_CARAN
MDWRRKKKKKRRTLERGAMLLEELIECCDGKSNPIKFFSAHEIHKATNNFNKSNQVSKYSDPYYKWYSGKDKNHPMIVIRKPLFDSYRHGNFYRDVAVSSMVSGHKNFMKMVGCCLEFDCPAIVYHGVKKHDQLNHIISRQTWKRRMKIAEDIATALAYLHTAFPRPFVYRNMWLENILLDEDGVAKLSDFSYCVAIPKGETFVKVYSSLYGDIYMDSKYMKDGVVSVETDVYAFGMLMQKLLNGFREVWVDKLFHRTTGKEISDDSIIEKDLRRRYIQNWLLKLMEEGRMDEITDPKMLEKMGKISEGELCQMKAFLMLSHRCIGEVELPTMMEVAKELKKIQRSIKSESSSPSGETQFDSPQHIASSSSQTRLKYKGILMKCFNGLF